jgi:DNA invertase Pin-like site-specific DNA recombinase
MVAQPVSRPRAAVYCRVSSEAQEDGASLDEQERIGRDYAAQHGLAVVEVYREVYDGEEIERPVLRQLLAADKRGAAAQGPR